MDWIILALKNLSKLCPPSSNVIRGGLLEKLLDLVLFDNQDPDVVQNTIEALCNLCAGPEIRKYLALQGGLEAACELCLSEFPSTQYYALCLMRELLSSPTEGVIDRFHEADGMSTIMTLLNTEELKYLHASTLEVLANLLGVPVIAHELSKKKIYEFLLDQALSKTYQGQTDFQAFAARCISRAVNYSDQRLIMNSVNVEKKILQLLTLPSYIVQAAALEAVGNLSKTLNCRRNFRKLDIVPAISKHLTICDPGVREQAYFAAGTLMLYEADLAERFVKEGFFKQLQDTLTDVKLFPVCGLIDNALACVINLSETDALKEPLAKFMIRQIPELLAHPDESIKIKVRFISPQ
ncbi:hypothetical protein RvY_05520 [Ramazzottius varieornatus]|uniref:Armadillo repeat-containing domain-containing protein n=1 Tax=Ramazzottius varieornatus TaxID=947166 RepID=A0A1D1UVU5_RAMVA|nr:hypothetical protein RvY_05520 [Ramazzottius varieornatus]